MADTGSCSMYVACVILTYVSMSIIISGDAIYHTSTAALTQFDEVKKKYIEEYQNVSLYNGPGVSLYNAWCVRMDTCLCWS